MSDTYEIEVIERNSVQCLNPECMEEIVSEHRHDFKFCKCGNVAVDGGKNYRRRVYREDFEFKDTSIFHTEQRKYHF